MLVSKMVLPANSHLKKCKEKGFVLVPQWKTSYVYPVLLTLKHTSCCPGVLVYSGAGIFVQGAEAGSYFGHGYHGNVKI